MTDARYPIGPFSFDAVLDCSPEARHRRIAAIAALPQDLRAIVADAGQDDLARTYRAGGWSVRQLVHHIPDSHLNGYARFKLALSEVRPTIKPYDQDGWAALDLADEPIEHSLDLLDALHRRWLSLLERMNASDFARAYIHPAHNRSITLDASLANYAWHGEHHAAQIRLALRR